MLLGRSHISDHSTVKDYVPEGVIIATFSGTIVLSVLGNSYVILSFVVTKHMKSVTTLFILSKSLSDLLVGSVVSAFAMMQTLRPGQALGLACQMPVYVELTCIAASIFSLLAVGVDRYIAVIHPTKRILTFNKAALVIILIWILSALYSLRLKFQFHKKHGYERLFCNLLVEERQENQVFRAVDFAMLLVLPMLVLCYMYFRIGKRLWGAARGTGKHVRRKKKIVKYLAISLSVFCLSWFPFYVLDIVGDSLKVGLPSETKHSPRIEGIYLKFRFAFAVLAVSSCFISPFIYITFFSTIRRGTKVAVMRVLGRGVIEQALVTPGFALRSQGTSPTMASSLKRFAVVPMIQAPRKQGAVISDGRPSVSFTAFTCNTEDAKSVSKQWGHHLSPTSDRLKVSFPLENEKMITQLVYNDWSE